MAKYDAMLIKQSDIIKEKISRTLLTIEELFINSDKITYRNVAQKANVSITFIYAHIEIVKKIEEYQAIPPNSIFTERYNRLKEENEKLNHMVLKFEEQILAKHCL